MILRYFIKLISNFIIKIYQDKKLLLVFVFFLSILISLFFLLFLKNIGPEQHNIPGRDYLDYYAPIAERIIKGEGIPVKELIGISKEHLGTFYPIGYPLILSVLFYLSDLLDVEKLRLIIIFNVFVTALATCFFFLFTKSILNKKVALISSFLWMTYPFNLWLIKNPNTEVLFILFLYLALWVYVLAVKKYSFKLFLAAGALIGFASLIRAISVFLVIPLVILIFFLIRRTSFKKRTLFSLILLVAYIIVISPWIIYVFMNIGKIIPVSESGSRSIHYGLILMVDLPKEGKLSLSNDVIDLINRSRDKKIEDSFLNAVRFFKKEFISHPITLFKLIGIKMMRSWYATGVTWWEREILLIQFIYLIPAIAGLIVWLKRIKEKTIYLIFLLTVISYFWALTVVAHSILRYMIPVMGIVMIFSSVIWCYFIDRIIMKFKINC